MALLPIILEEIAARGPMRFDRFMELCLTHPEYGYYNRGETIGGAGDFITAPEVSPVFGEVIAAWVMHMAQTQNMESIALTELGPGRGTLLADMLRVMKPTPPAIHLVETSSTLMEKQRAALTQFEKQMQITWHKDINALPDTPLFFIANEFFDCLPARRFMKKQGAWHEIHIGQADGKLMEIPREAENDCALPDDHTASHAVIAPATATIADAISARIAHHGGGALVIDYGHASPFGDSTQAVRGHAAADMLAHPGKTDISAWVDFSRFTHAAAAHGITTAGTVEMGGFLGAIGIKIRAEALAANPDATPQSRRALAAAIDRLTSPAHMGRAFKVLAMLPQDTPQPVAGF